MEDYCAKVAAPVVIHQKHALDKDTLTKKHSLRADSSSSVENSSFDVWNPRCWSWDNTAFVANSLQCQGGQTGNIAHTSPPLSGKFDLERDALRLKQPSNSVSNDDGLDQEEEAEQVLNYNKRVKSISSDGSVHPICQVDGCNENLSNSKEYHRRHKVCELHSKATNVLVGEQMQRFCQQCSRFHPLHDFDEGRRSCRRRLAGHNKRRRKTQPEDSILHARVPSSQLDCYIHCGRDIVSLLSVLARDEGTGARIIQFSKMPEKDHRVQLLSRIKPLSSQVNLVAKPALQKTIEASENQNQRTRSVPCPSTRDFLGLLSSDPALCPSYTAATQPFPSTAKIDLHLRI